MIKRIDLKGKILGEKFENKIPLGEIQGCGVAEWQVRMSIPWDSINNL